MLLPKQNRIRDKKHRIFISQLPCLVSGATNVQCCHIRSGCFSAGMKPCDSLCLPLSCEEHSEQHRVGEVKYWEPYGGTERATELAKELYKHTGDRDKALELMEEFTDG